MSYQDHHPSRHGYAGQYSPSSSGTATPTNAAAGASYIPSLSGLSGLVGGGFGGLVRRFSDLTAAMPGQQQHDPSQPVYSHGASSLSYTHHDYDNNGISGVYTPPTLIHRTASPMAPPPLEPLELKGYRDDTTHSARLLTTAVAEEIRIMIPERQRIDDEWNLVYSLDQDGASLGTLYKKCAAYEHSNRRASFVLVVRDEEGGLFGAYLSDPPHPSAHYFGNGECFLWRASVLASLPPPPSTDTTNLNRVTTIASPTQTSFPKLSQPPLAEPSLIDFSDSPPASFSTTSILVPPPQPQSEPQLLPQAAANIKPPPSPSIRFKAFPYSGENDFYIYCEPHWLSVGGGDGHYGLWLDDSLLKGVSSRCLTFGNEPLSDEGEKFGVLGVEVWLIGRGGRR